MNNRDYFQLGIKDGGYNPAERYQYLKNNFSSVEMLNGHTLYVKLKTGETIELCDTGMTAGFPLLDFCVLVNDLIKKGSLHETA